VRSPASTSSSVRSLAPWKGRLVVLAGVVLVGLNLRIAVAAVSPILDVVREDVALTATQVGLLGTIPVFSFALFGSLAAPIARRLGLEPTLIGSLVLSAVGEVARAEAGTAAAFLGWSIIALAGMGMGNVLLPPLVKRYFPDRIGPVTAAYTVTLTIGTAVPPLVALPAADLAGWRAAIGVWSLLGLVAAVPWLFVVLRSVTVRAELRELLRRSPARATDVRRPTGVAGLVWRSRLAWALAVSFGCNSLGTYVAFAWLPQLLADAGLGSDAGGRWLALYSVLGLPASLVAPVLAARLRNPYPMVVLFVACWAAGYVGLFTAPAQATALWMVLLGIGPSTFPVLLVLIGLRSGSPAVASVLSGMVQGVGYTVAGLGPLGIGLLYEATGGWHVPLLALGGVLVVLLVTAWGACRPGIIEAHDEGPVGSTPAGEPVEPARAAEPARADAGPAAADADPAPADADPALADADPAPADADPALAGADPALAGADPAPADPGAAEAARGPSGEPDARR